MAARSSGRRGRGPPAAAGHRRRPASRGHRWSPPTPASTPRWRLGLPVDLVVGDLDSATPTALEAAEGGARSCATPSPRTPPTWPSPSRRGLPGMGGGEIIVLGGHGGRLDHLLATSSWPIADHAGQRRHCGHHLGRPPCTSCAARTCTVRSATLVTLQPVGARHRRAHPRPPLPAADEELEPAPPASATSSTTPPAPSGRAGRSCLADRSTPGRT